MSTKDEAINLASEIIAGMSRKIEELNGEKKMSVNDILKQIISQNIDIDDKLHELSVNMDKIRYAAERISEIRELDMEEVHYSKENADNFFLRRYAIRNDLDILLDYFARANDIVKELRLWEVA